jgi:hypothetical protein
MDDGIVVSSEEVERTVSNRRDLELVVMNDRDREELLSTATDRFERRLAEECGSLRREIGQLRVDMVTQGAEIRQEVSSFRLEVAEQFGALKTDAADKHVELLKWALVFWVGQAASVAAIIKVLQ